MNYQQTLDKMKKSFVKFYRDYGNHKWSSDPKTMAVLIRCLLNANLEDGYFCGHLIKRGSFATSLSALSKQCGVSVQSIRTALSRLKIDKIIDIETVKNQHAPNTISNTLPTSNQQGTNTLPTQGFTIVTLCDSDIYNDLQDVHQQGINTPPTNNQHTPNTDSNTLPTRIKEQEYREEERELDKSNSSSDLPSDAAPSHDLDDNIGYAALAEYWNNTTKGVWGKIRDIKNDRRNRVRARIREHGKQTFATAIKMATDSQFLRDKKWFSFDWMIRPNNFDKLISGNYNHDDKQSIAVNVSRTGHRLGVDEFLRPNGSRTYGSGRVTIPDDAPPRPGEKFTWDAQSKNWICF